MFIACEAIVGVTNVAAITRCLPHVKLLQVLLMLLLLLGAYEMHGKTYCDLYV